jgi:hypothetical protein
VWAPLPGTSPDLTCIMYDWNRAWQERELSSAGVSVTRLVKRLRFADEQLAARGEAGTWWTPDRLG